MSSFSRAAPAISRGGSGLPSRLIFYGIPSIGKTSFGASAPDPIFSMTRGETGLLTLIDNGIVPPTDHFAEAMTWEELRGQVEWLTDSPTGNKAYVLDTLNGAARLCFDHVVAESFNGSITAFGAYGKGMDVLIAEWIRFITSLDRLRERRRMGIIALCHMKIKSFKNPDGDDFDRYTPDLEDKLWGPAFNWADMVLFANFETFAKKEKGAMRAKGVGGTGRVIYTQRTAAFDAKEKGGLPAEIPMLPGTAGGWRAFVEAGRVAREKRQAAAQALQAAAQAALQRVAQPAAQPQVNESATAVAVAVPITNTPANNEEQSQ